MLSFLFGVVVTSLIFGWRDYQRNKQLNEILNSLSQFEQVGGLSKIAQIRRKLNLFNNRYSYTKLELKLYRHLIDNIPLGYLRVSESNYLIECNQEARKILNIQRWQPKSFRLFLELVRSYELDQLIQQTRKTQKQLAIEWQFFPANNDIFEQAENIEKIDNNQPLFLKAHSYPLPAGEIAIFIENRQLIQDLITRRDQAYSDLSHELRTPLTSILLIVETLIKYTDNKTKIWIDKIYQEINRLINLVQNWLEIYQLEQNPYEILTFQSLNLKQLILSAWKSVEILAEKSKMSFEYLGDEDIIIEADINRLTQVFVNLFDNSIKYSGTEGTIQVNVTVQKENSNNLPLVEINLIDSGIGFNQIDLPYIFERLYRGDKSRTKTSIVGTGLGLSIVKQIIEGHQGTISADNHPQTKGAWFVIKLPLKHQQKNN